MATDRESLSSLEREKASVFHAWSAQSPFNPLMMKTGHGSWLVTEDGREFLDLSSQLVNTNIGHQHPKVVAAIKEQADLLTTISPFHGNEARYLAAEKILDHAFDGAAKVFFTTGGTEAVENAVRMARLHTGRPKLLSAYRSYHGGTGTSNNLTGDPRRWSTDWGTGGVVHFFAPFLYRSPFFATTEQEECERALEHLENTVRFEGPDTIAAIVLESIAGTAGIMIPPKGYLRGVRDICDRYGIVYIADEVMSGFGRSGKWFAYEHGEVAPDLVTFAKGVNSGYVPLGGVIVNEAISATFNDRAYPGGLTYSGHPLACASAVATITAMEEEGVVENAARLGEEILRPELQQLREKHRVIGEVRGAGTFFALDLVKDRATKETFSPFGPHGTSSPQMIELLGAIRAENLLVFQNFHRIHVTPACNIPDEELRDGLRRLDRALAVADAHYTGA